jgi:hypothetical protein
MSGGLDGPGPHERVQPTGRRIKPGTDEDEETGNADRWVVLSALVENEAGVLADVTVLFSRRQIYIERIVGEPVGDNTHSRITFVVEPPHPGVEQLSTPLEKLRHVVNVLRKIVDLRGGVLRGETPCSSASCFQVSSTWSGTYDFTGAMSADIPVFYFQPVIVRYLLPANRGRTASGTNRGRTVFPCGTGGGPIQARSRVATGWR